MRRIAFEKVLRTKPIAKEDSLWFEDDVPRKFEDEMTPVQRLDQQTPYFCGAACAVMILRRYNVSTDQSSAYHVIHNDARFEIEKLYSDPKGMQEYLLEQLPAASYVPSINSGATFTEALSCIFNGISFANAPCAVLVHDGNHWVVVDGARILVNGRGDSAIVGVFVQNPTTGSTPECYVEADEFKKIWLTPNQYGRTWLNKFVTVGSNTAEHGKPVNAISVVDLFAVKKNGLDETLATDDLIKMALGNLLANGFSDANAISGGGADVTQPIPVYDESDNFSHWIVPVDLTQDKTFSDFCYCALNTGSGALLEVARMDAALNVLNDKEVTALLANQFSGQVIDVRPRFYWIRSAYVLSRFDVVRLATVSGKQVSVFKGGIVRSFPEKATSFGG
ncbi:hypothetical protein [Paraburkholderia sp.]|uniref:hypothetical protein n=1 Tax=Paraburkholderia sp. TaxID=1926495 RepID=UPI00286EDD55|nr:hypothetical protein [Paraburkholderia sp.]